MNARAVAPGLDPLSRLRGVRGVVLTSLSDALPIEARAHVGVDVDALAAFGVGLYRRARAVADCSEAGPVRIVSIDAAHGRVAATARGDLLVVVLADREAHPGLLRVSMLHALEGLA